MQELPCPLCGHLHPKPSHGSKFKCKGCTQWLELSKDKTQLQDHTARKAADEAKTADWWHQQALIRQRKLCTDYDTAMDIVRADHNKNVQKMKDERRGHELFPPDFSTPQTATASPTPQTIVSRVVSTDDTTEAPW